MKLTVFTCGACGTTVFPARYFCPSCGAAEWQPVATDRGTVTEATVVHHRIAAEAGGEPLRIATVRTAPGPVVVARLEGAADSGDAVTIDVDDAQRILVRRAS